MRNICGISINHQGCLVISGDVFDVSNVPSLRKTMARVRGNELCSVSCDLIDVKSEGMHDICGMLIDHQSSLVISGDGFYVDNASCLQKVTARASPWQLPLPSAVEHQSPPSPFRHLTEFCMLISPYILHNAILHNTNTHHHTGQQ